MLSLISTNLVIHFYDPQGWQSFAALFLLPLGFLCGAFAGDEVVRCIQRRLNKQLRAAKRQVRLLYVASILAAVVGIGAAGIECSGRALHPPRDRELLANFERNGAKFKPREQQVYRERRDSKSKIASKGYFYCEQPPTPLLPSLDGYGFSRNASDVQRVYRHIKGNWYLYFEYFGP